MAGAQGSQGRVVGKDQDQVTQDLIAAAVRAEPGMITLMSRGFWWKADLRGQGGAG